MKHEIVKVCNHMSASHGHAWLPKLHKGIKQKDEVDT